VRSWLSRSRRSVDRIGLPRHVGAYLYPCVGRSSCPSAWQQVQNVHNYFEGQGYASGGVWAAMLTCLLDRVIPDSFWLDIESGGVCPWAGTTTNQNFLKSLVSAAQSLWGSKVGIYSGMYQWESIFGSTSWNPGYGSIP
jgi:hypothetical protein